MMSPNSVLVLVAYYLEDVRQVEALVERFEAETGLGYDVVLLVENGVPLSVATARRDIRLVDGDNSAWEFSGMVAGLKAGEALAPQVCTVLNDSYGRNWDVSTASQGILRTMHDWASRGGVAAWRDVFAWFPFQQRTNSRLLMTGGRAMSGVHASLEAAINREKELTEAGEPLFSDADARTLGRWEAKNAGRWSTADLAGRRRRIYVEHTMLDALVEPAPAFFPKGPVSAVQYTLRRKLEGERR